MYIYIPQKKKINTGLEQHFFFKCLHELFLWFVSSEAHCLYFYPCILCKSPLLNSQSSNFSQNFSGYLDVWGSVGMEVALCAFSFSLSLSGPAVISQPWGWKKCFLPLSFSLSLCASGNSKLTFSSWNAASVFERLWNCSGEQHRTAALPPRLYSPIFHPRRNKWRIRTLCML